MLDTCTITRIQALETDPLTAEVTEVLHTVYEGKCKVAKVSTTRSNTEYAGGNRSHLTEYRLGIPWTVSDLRVGDLVVIDTADADATLVGLEFRVREVHAGTLLVQRRAYLDLVR